MNRVAQIGFGLVITIAALGAGYFLVVSDPANVNLPLGILLIASLYLVFHIKLVGRNFVFLTLSSSAAWLFLCNSPLYVQHYSVMAMGRWIALGATVAVSFVAGLHAGRRVRLRFIVLLPFLMGAYFYLTMFWSVNPDLTVDRSVSVLLLATSVLGVIWYAGSSISSLEQAIKAVLLPISLLFWILTAIYGFDLSYYIERGQLRTPGPMLNPNGIGVLGALLAPVAYYLWQTTRPRSTVWLGSLLTCVLMVLLSGTRGALAAILLAFTLISLTRKRSFSMGVFVSGALASIGFVAVDIYGLPEIVHSYLRTESLASGSGRWEAWAAAVELLRERPWTGYGFGTEDLLFDQFGIRFFEHGGAMVHNSYLGLSLQIGLLGAAIFFYPLILVALKGVRASMKSKEDSMLSSLVGTLIAGLVICFTESWIYSAGNSQSLPFWIMFGILVRLLIGPRLTAAEAFSRMQPSQVRKWAVPEWHPVHRRSREEKSRYPLSMEERH